jgi:hypothetical protein
MANKTSDGLDVRGCMQQTRMCSMSMATAGIYNIIKESYKVCRIGALLHDQNCACVVSTVMSALWSAVLSGTVVVCHASHDMATPTARSA